MEKFEIFTGTAVPLRRSNVDTDQLAPAVFLKRITAVGYDDALFAAIKKYLKAVDENVIKVSERDNPEPGSDPEEIQAFLAERDAAQSMRDELADPIIAGALASSRRR